jgi:hypothetical protein
MANVIVYYASQELANTLIDIQDLFISQRSDLKIEFDRLKQENMKYCCGNEPPADIKEKYEQLKATMIQQHQL